MERLGSMVLISFQSNQSLLLQGERNRDYIAFCVEQTNAIDMHRVWGEKIQPHSIHGFSSRLSEAFFQTTPGSLISIALLPIARLKAIAELESMGSFMETIEANNTAVLPDQQFTQIKTLLQPNNASKNPNAKSNSDLVEALLVECFSHEGKHQPHAPSLTHRTELIRELIEFSFKQSTSPLSLHDICNIIFTSPTTITVGCREMLGLGPMALLKRIRLQQVQHVLIDLDLQQRLGYSTVQQIANHYGFQSRNHFARDYKLAFGLTPQQTLRRTKSLATIQ